MEVTAGDLARIESRGGRLTVGAMVRERLAERSADVTTSVPLLAREVGRKRPCHRDPSRSTFGSSFCFSRRLTVLHQVQVHVGHLRWFHHHPADA
jgi:hypothetical protein